MTNNKPLGESLIFLISQPRAGSTLLQRTLAAHPTIHSVTEPWVMLHPVYALKETGMTAEYQAGAARNALNDFLQVVNGGEEAYLDALRAFAETLYSRALDGTGKTIFLDKTPRYYYIIPELYRLFPNAHFIFLLRNPLAVLHSIFTSFTKGKWENLSRSSEDLLRAPQLLLDGIDLLDGKAIVVRYEQLVTDPESTIVALCKRLGLPFEPAMLQHENRPQLHGKFGDKAGIRHYTTITNQTLAKWHRLGENRQTRYFALRYLDDLTPAVVRQMGYDFDELRLTIKKQKPPYQLIRLPWNTVKQPLEPWSIKWIIIKNVAIFQRKGLVSGLIDSLQRGWQALRRN